MTKKQKNVAILAMIIIFSIIVVFVLTTISVKFESKFVLGLASAVSISSLIFALFFGSNINAKQ